MVEQLVTNIKEGRKYISKKKKRMNDTLGFLQLGENLTFLQ